MRYFLLFLIMINLITACGQKTELISDWRGPNRDGIYPETGLLKSWPETGPEMAWSFEGLGAGHGSVGFSHDKIFCTGNARYNWRALCFRL
jgi:outer membrane protein assembly factor BamB